MVTSNYNYLLPLQQFLLHLPLIFVLRIIFVITVLLGANGGPLSSSLSSSPFVVSSPIFGEPTYEVSTTTGGDNDNNNNNNNIPLLLLTLQYITSDYIDEDMVHNNVILLDPNTCTIPILVGLRDYGIQITQYPTSTSSSNSVDDSSSNNGIIGGNGLKHWNMNISIEPSIISLRDDIYYETEEEESSTTTSTSYYGNIQFCIKIEFDTKNNNNIIDYHTNVGIDNDDFDAFLIHMVYEEKKQTMLDNNVSVNVEHFDFDFNDGTISSNNNNNNNNTNNSLPL